MMSGLGHTSLTQAACIVTTAATAPVTPDVPISPVPRYNILVRKISFRQKGVYMSIYHTVWLNEG